MEAALRTDDVVQRTASAPQHRRPPRTDRSRCSLSFAVACPATSGMLQARTTRVRPDQAKTTAVLHPLVNAWVPPDVRAARDYLQFESRC
jgi:hypothetical protein